MGKGRVSAEENQRLKEQCDSLGLTMKEKAKIGAIYGGLAAITVVLVIFATYIGIKYAVLAGLGLVSYVLGSTSCS